MRSHISRLQKRRTHPDLSQRSSQLHQSEFRLSLRTSKERADEPLGEMSCQHRHMHVGVEPVASLLSPEEEERPI